MCIFNNITKIKIIDYKFIKCYNIVVLYIIIENISLYNNFRIGDEIC